MIGNVATYRFTSDASVVDAARTRPDDLRANSCSWSGLVPLPSGLGMVCMWSPIPRRADTA